MTTFVCFSIFILNILHKIRYTKSDTSYYFFVENTLKLKLNVNEINKKTNNYF